MSESFSLQPKNLDQALQLADIMAKSQMVPKIYQGQPGNVLVAVQMGADLGMKPMQALQSIAVVNGNPALWGDGLRAMIMSASDLVKVDESFDEATMTATCTIVRRMPTGGDSTFKHSFSQKDAQEAGLWGRNTWKQYPKRMLQWRAFGWSARDAYADRLKGIKLAEEVMDYQPMEKEVSSTESKPVGSIADLMAEPKQESQQEQQKQLPSKAAQEIFEALKTADSMETLDKLSGNISKSIRLDELSEDEANHARKLYGNKRKELTPPKEEE